MVNKTFITGTLIWYYYICHREVWFMSRQLIPWQENPFIEVGRLISENSYEKERKEVRVENIVIDLLRTDKENIVICEIKKSSHFEKSAKMQLLYYLFKLKQLGIEATGQILFPKEKKRIQVVLTKDLENEILDVSNKINLIIQMDTPPQLKRLKFCSKCGYQEFCWA